MLEKSSVQDAEFFVFLASFQVLTFCMLRKLFKGRRADLFSLQNSISRLDMFVCKLYIYVNLCQNRTYLVLNKIILSRI